MYDLSVDIACVRAASEGRDMREVDTYLPDFDSMSDIQLSDWVQDGSHVGRSMVVVAYLFSKNRM